MSARAPVAEIVADIVQSGSLTTGHMAAGAMFATHGAVPDIVAYLFTAAARKRPDPALLDATAALLETSLEELRMSINGGDPHAPAALGAVHQAIARRIARGNVPETALVRVAHAFARARLEPGADLLAAIAAVAPDDAAPALPMSRGAIEQSLLGLAGAMGHDPYEIFGELRNMSTMMPPDKFGAMAAMLSDAPVPSLRVASLGFALDRDPAQAAEALAGMVSNGEYIAADRVPFRLRIMRPWLAPHRHVAIDEAIGAFSGPPEASAPPEPATVLNWLATAGDGAGGSSLFATAKLGRGYVLAGLLFKTHVGVDDAWVHTGMRKAEIDAAVRQVVQSAGAEKISLGLARRMLANALAVNLAGDAPPPFGLVNLCEVLGLGEVTPQDVPVETLVAETLAGLPPDRTGPAATAQAHAASKRWLGRMAKVESWFEAGPEVHDLLRKARTHAQRQIAIMEKILPGRRAFWARTCAWSAAILRDSSGHQQTWIDLALVARDLAGETPLSEIPLAAAIATQTVRAFDARR